MYTRRLRSVGMTSPLHAVAVVTASLPAAAAAAQRWQLQQGALAGQ